MSDIPNPIGAFEIFSRKKVKVLKAKKTHPLHKLSKKLAKNYLVKNLPQNRECKL
jgi:hypothetical protein